MLVELTPDGTPEGEDRLHPGDGIAFTVHRGQANVQRLFGGIDESGPSVVDDRNSSRPAAFNGELRLNSANAEFKRSSVQPVQCIPQGPMRCVHRLFGFSELVLARISHHRHQSTARVCA